MKDNELLILKAMEIALRYGQIDGAHHKAWVIDQMMRALTDCPMVKKSGVDCNSKQYEYETYGESALYERIIRRHNAGKDGPDTYGWDVGIAP